MQTRIGIAKSPKWNSSTPVCGRISITCFFTLISIGLLKSGFKPLEVSRSTQVNYQHQNLADASSAAIRTSELLAEDRSFEALVALTNSTYSHIEDGSREIAIYSLYVGDCYAYHLPVSASRNTQFARRHSLSFFAFTKPYPWRCEGPTKHQQNRCNKLGKYVLARALLDHFQSVVFLDADAGILDCSFNIKQQLFNPYSSVYFTTRNVNTPLVLNTGLFAIRKTDFSMLFLERVFETSRHPPIYPTGRVGNGSEVRNFTGVSTYNSWDIYDQKWVTDTLALLPYYTVDSFVSLQDVKKLNCAPKYGCLKGPSLPFILHCEGVCSRDEEKARGLNWTAVAKAKHQIGRLCNHSLRADFLARNFDKRQC